MDNHAVLIIVIAICYILKQKSANGRVLIWRSVVGMLPDVPFQGLGFGGFHQSYMNYQAAYLENIYDEKIRMLADNVYSPFNEYLNFYISFGVLGLLLIIPMIIILWRLINRATGKEHSLSVRILIGLGVLSLCSYPFSYPHTYIICFAILGGTLQIFEHIHNNSGIQLLRKFFPLCCIMLGVYLICINSKNFYSEYLWKRAYISQNTSCYDDIYPTLSKNPFFLYNYSVVLLGAHNSQKSLEVALQCEKLLSNYDLELLLGDIYMNNGNYKEAEHHYIKASKMCPCRFMPLNLLYDIYKKNGDDEKAFMMAVKIVNKPVKIKSLTVNQIKFKMGQIVQSSNSK